MKDLNQGKSVSRGQEQSNISANLNNISEKKKRRTSAEAQLFREELRIKREAKKNKDVTMTSDTKVGLLGLSSGVSIGENGTIFNRLMEPRVQFVQDKTQEVWVMATNVKEQLSNALDDHTKNVLVESINPDGLWSVVLTVFHDKPDILTRMFARMYKEEYMQKIARYVNR